MPITITSNNGSDVPIAISEAIALLQIIEALYNNAERNVALYI
jgi:hypothetical protein